MKRLSFLCILSLGVSVPVSVCDTLTANLESFNQGLSQFKAALEREETQKLSKLLLSQGYSAAQIKQFLDSLTAQGKTIEDVIQAALKGTPVGMPADSGQPSGSSPSNAPPAPDAPPAPGQAPPAPPAPSAPKAPSGQPKKPKTTQLSKQDWQKLSQEERKKSDKVLLATLRSLGAPAIGTFDAIKKNIETRIEELARDKAYNDGFRFWQTPKDLSSRVSLFITRALEVSKPGALHALFGSLDRTSKDFARLFPEWFFQADQKELEKAVRGILINLVAAQRKDSKVSPISKEAAQSDQAFENAINRSTSPTDALDRLNTLRINPAYLQSIALSDILTAALGSKAEQTAEEKLMEQIRRTVKKGNLIDYLLKPKGKLPQAQMLEGLVFEPEDVFTQIKTKLKSWEKAAPAEVAHKVIGFEEYLNSYFKNVSPANLATLIKSLVDRFTQRQGETLATGERIAGLDKRLGRVYGEITTYEKLNKYLKNPQWDPAVEAAIKTAFDDQEKARDFEKQLGAILSGNDVLTHLLQITQKPDNEIPNLEKPLISNLKKLLADPDMSVKALQDVLRKHRRFKNEGLKDEIIQKLPKKVTTFSSLLKILSYYMDKPDSLAKALEAFKKLDKDNQVIDVGDPDFSSQLGIAVLEEQYKGTLAPLIASLEKNDVAGFKKEFLAYTDKALPVVTQKAQQLLTSFIGNARSGQRKDVKTVLEKLQRLDVSMIAFPADYANRRAFKTILDEQKAKLQRLEKSVDGLPDTRVTFAKQFEEITQDISTKLKLSNGALDKKGIKAWQDFATQLSTMIKIFE